MRVLHMRQQQAMSTAQRTDNTTKTGKQDRNEPVLIEHEVMRFSSLAGRARSSVE